MELRHEGSQVGLGRGFNLELDLKLFVGLVFLCPRFEFLPMKFGYAFMIKRYLQSETCALDVHFAIGR